MKKMLLLAVCLAIAGCGPSSSQIEAAIARTEAARPTIAPSPTALPSAMVTPIPTPTRTPPPTLIPAMTVDDAEVLALPRGYLFSDYVDADGAACRQAIRFDTATMILIYGMPAASDDLKMIEMIVVLEGYGVSATAQLAEIQWFLQIYGSAEISTWAMGHMPEFGEDMQVGIFERFSALVAANSANTITFAIIRAGVPSGE